MTTSHFNQRSKYFEKPKTWMKSNAFAIQEENIKLDSQIQFFKKAINKVKKELGKNCSFLTYVQEGSKNYFFAKLIIQSNNKVPFKVNIDKDFKDLTAEDYKQLNIVLHEQLKKYN